MLANSKDIRIFNQLLGALNICDAERIINIREDGTADSNFIVTHLMKQIFQENNRICFVILHNNLEHYQVVAKKLGYDIFRNVKDNNMKVIEPFCYLFEHIGEVSFTENVEVIRKKMFEDINIAYEDLAKNFDGSVYIVIDDISHLLDIGVDLKDVLSFLNYCVHIVSNTLRLVINSHICSRQDQILANYLSYVSDVNIEVLPLNTGKSTDVSGFLHIQRRKNNSTENNQYHFKAFDRGIRVFSLGESVYNLYK